MLLILLISALTSFKYIQGLPTIGDLSGQRILKDADGEYLGWYVPLIYGRYQWISREEYELGAVSIQTSQEDIKYYLYTKESPTMPQQIPYNDVVALKASNFNSSRPTRVVIHGWMNSCKSRVNREITPALLASGDYNVICVGWDSISINLYYPYPRYAVDSVGKFVAQHLDFLHKEGGMQFADLWCIGHSLGAHVCGFAGKNVALGRISIIFGLDTALPLFYYTDKSARLSSDDAEYVESIHTSGGKGGFLDPIGHCSFYPNGGKSQPACPLDASGLCSHLLAHTYFAESCTHNSFLTYNCSSAENAVKNNCDSTFSSIRMGCDAKHCSSGYFYVPVRKSPLYGYGA